MMGNMKTGGIWGREKLTAAPVRRGGGSGGIGWG